MFNTKKLDELSFCTAVKYTSGKDYSCDYSTAPRPCHNLVFMLEGEGTIQTENSTLQIKKGDILYIPQNSTYISHWKAVPHCIFHSVHFKFALSQEPFNGKKTPVQLLPNEQFVALYEAVKTIQEHQYSKAMDAYLYLSAFYYLCGILLPCVQVEDRIFFESNVSPAVRYLENNYTEHCTIDQLAALCYLSPSRFFYLFKKHIGCSPIAYKNKIAVQKAAHALILHKDKTIENIAYEYGFNSPIYFRRLFKKLTGKTPSQYRKEDRLI